MKRTNPTNSGGQATANPPIFGARDMLAAAPRREFPEHGMRPEDAYQLVHDELFLDGNARQNLATFCQTWEDDYVHRLMDISLSKNWIDKDEYPQTAAISMRCVNMIGKLWNVPEPEGGQVTGTATIGSSEACMLGGMAAKWRWRARQKAAGKPIDKPNLVCGPVQVCWHKFCRYWDVEKREIPMEPGQLTMDPKRMLEAVDENTIVVVPTFGVTYTGQYEFPEDIQEALDGLQKRKGLDIDIHVDAASGGFLSPFCAPEIPFDFRLPRVKSISASGHKYGLAPLGAGWVIWREKKDLPEDLVFSVDYLGGSVGTFAINFSRPAGQTIAQYYDFLRLGQDGYREIHMASYRTAQWIGEQIAPLGPFEFIFDGDEKKGIPAVCFRIKEGENPGYNLYDLSDRLRERGWLVPAFLLSGKCSDITVMRVMCRQGFSQDMAALLMEDIKAGIAHFEKHPVSKSLSPQEGTSFHHS
jgi:glutamate decarboxylase